MQTARERTAEFFAFCRKARFDEAKKRRLLGGRNERLRPTHEDDHLRVDFWWWGEEFCRDNCAETDFVIDLRGNC